MGILKGDRYVHCSKVCDWRVNGTAVGRTYIAKWFVIGLTSAGLLMQHGAGYWVVILQMPWCSVVTAKHVVVQACKYVAH